MGELVDIVVLLTLLMATVGVSTLGWSLVGLARLPARRRRRREAALPLLTPADVAILVAAHNEELVIADTIRSALAQVPPGNVFVASDGSTDATEAIAEAAGATVAAITPNRGKAGAIVAALEQFGIADRFEVLLLLDADTQLRPDYLTTGLRLFDAPDVVAVAGRATTVWEPRPPTWGGRFLTAYRERLYVCVQYLQKFGQAAARINAVAIVPGFASMYRTSVLAHIDIAAPGLAIEDYNMTFEVHAKKLGRIAFDPDSAIAETQDPVTLGEYMSQVRRWSLGFWQTVGRHGMHRGTFWAALAFFVAEVIVSSIALVLVLPALLLSTLAWSMLEVGLLDGQAGVVAGAVVSALPPLLLLVGFVVPDLVVTLVAACLSRRRPPLGALLFPFMRVLDALLCLRAAGQAVGGTSDGRWRSPGRRAFAGPADPIARESEAVPVTPVSS